MVILALIKLQLETNLSQFELGKEHVKISKTGKVNVIKGHSSHFGSSGEFFSFGAKTNYGIIELSSVAPYDSTKYRSQDKTDLASVNAKIMEDMSYKELQCSIKNICRVMPNLRKYICPTLNVV